MEKDEPPFKSIEYPGEWSSYAFRPVFEMLGGVAPQNINTISYQLDISQSRKMLTEGTSLMDEILLQRVESR